MKTTININGLDVEFSDQKPTRPGVYWHTDDVENEPTPMWVHDHTIHKLIAQWGNHAVASLDGLWSTSPLVPAVEVEKAYREGYVEQFLKNPPMPKHMGQDMCSEARAASNKAYSKGRARRVVEGEQV